MKKFFKKTLKILLYILLGLIVLAASCHLYLNYGKNIRVSQVDEIIIGPWINPYALAKEADEEHDQPEEIILSNDQIKNFITIFNSSSYIYGPVKFRSSYVAKIKLKSGKVKTYSLGINAFKDASGGCYAAKDESLRSFLTELYK